MNIYYFFYILGFKVKKVIAIWIFRIQEQIIKKSTQIKFQRHGLTIMIKNNKSWKVRSQNLSINKNWELEIQRQGNFSLFYLC